MDNPEVTVRFKAHLRV